MEKNINLAKILNGKPVNTKLWSPLFGDVYTSSICSEDTIIVVNHHAESSSFYNNGKYFNHAEAELLLFPSKEIRDWSKFAWKKGDVLVSEDNVHIIFEKFENDAYTKFRGKYYLYEECYNEEVFQMETSVFEKATDDDAQTYIKTIEERLGGKLNRETLEIEKQLEFKDGDIVFMKGIKGVYFANCIFILRSEYKDGDERAFYYAFYNADDKFTIAEYGYTRVHYSLRPATDSEKQQLFDALAKKNKRWYSEKKQIVDLKPKFDELKPFDNVLVRHQKTEEWRANIFSHTDKTDEYLDYVCVNGRWEFCIPYEGNESLLGTTKDVEG